MTSGPAPPGGQAIPESVRETARQFAYDRYLSALLAPHRARPALMAVAAFDGELARISGAVSEPMLGEIRLQWWRDALASVRAGDATGHPVADAFAGALIARNLPFAPAEGVIDARVFDFSASPMPDEFALRTYLAKTEGAAFTLAALILGARPGSTLDRISASAGVGYGLARLICELPRHGGADACVLPRTLMPDAGHTGDPGPALSALGDMAREQWNEARRGVEALPRAVRPAFLPLALVPAYLDAAFRPDRDASGQIALINPFGRVWRLWRASRRGLAN